MSEADEKTPAELEADEAEALLEGAGQVKDVEPLPVVEPEGGETVKVDGEGEEPVVEAVVDPLELPIPEDGKPTPSDWDKVHEVVRKLKEENKTLKATPAPAPEPVAPTKSEPEVSDDDIFTIAVDAQVDKYNDPAKSKSLLSQAQALMDDMTPERVLAVITKAKNGGFGDTSADVLIMARDTLQESTARALVNDKASRIEKEAESATNAEVAESFGKVAKKYPGLNDIKNNPALIAHAKKWREDNLGKTDDKGRLVTPGPLAPLLLSTTKWPELVAKLIVDSFKASGGTIDGAPTQTDPEYVPDAGGKKTGGDAPTAGAVDDVEKSLARLGNIRKG